MSNGVHRRASVPAFLALTLLLTACGTDSDGGGESAANVESTAVAAPAQQTSFGDFAAPEQVSPAGADSGQSPDSADQSPNDAATDSGQASSDAEANGPAHEVPVPGLAKEYADQIPEETSQVLVATSPDADSENSTLSFFEFEDKKWKKLKTFSAHNGSNGWLKDRREGDKTTPIGVFTLSDAGGFKPNPGTKLPYTQDDRLPSSATVAYGADYESVFDYIIAIDYNRKPGTPPTDKTRPMGWDKGGGIWLHLDHDSGTNGCVTLDEADLTWIMRTIDPDDHPRIAMGPETELKK
ncbi:L,D-transpeptidase family protein [Brevibacterium spongiae]|uniref:L,D-transpeptidase family protein n=1 Tax=Brevibacterium spongiae TaxID=2909672 RepID=A0ABY5SJ65_9MICO|nr:L,D-transpeptidase family protein [Brevibacterium spongiae]UVI34583.1 L,D-transpeptidase family protein [Brevibacterium spongiae]